MIGKLPLLSFVTFGVLKASDFDAFPEFLPSQIDISSITPLFDFTDNSCLPGVAISMEGERNGGLNPSGSVTGECRSSNFLDQSNTIHRYACVTNGGQDYCLHAFSLYFEKDQSTNFLGGGTRHELETVGVWTLDGAITDISVSDDTFLETFPVSDASFQGSNPLIVYAAVSGDNSHRFVLASSNHQVQNPTGVYVTPDVISWFEFSAGDFDNTVFRALLSSRFDFGAVDFLLKDELFLDAFNAVKPANYPFLTFTSAQEPNPQPSDEFVRFLNVGTGTCLNAAGGEANENVNLIESTQQIRSLENPSFCVDVDQTIQAAENIQLKSCDSAKSSQKWTRSGDQFLLSGLAMSSESGGTNVRLETNQNLNRQRFELFLLPTNSPTNAPTPLIQTPSPSLRPSLSPTFNPTAVPSEGPSFSPSFQPSFAPSASPTSTPTFFPTSFPIAVTQFPQPSFSPTASPTNEEIENVEAVQEFTNFLQENLFFLIIGFLSFFLLFLIVPVLQIKKKNRKLRKINYDTRRQFLRRSQHPTFGEDSAFSPRTKVFLSKETNKQYPAPGSDPEFPTFDEGLGNPYQNTLRAPAPGHEFF
eukprot:maker-scaffold_9-snap-gene-8.51-mRNA-1 protein AED:0.50 eAED:0.50 QI:0/0/0/1/1/1/2/0/587